MRTEVTSQGLAAELGRGGQRGQVGHILFRRRRKLALLGAKRNEKTPHSYGRGKGGWKGSNTTAYFPVCKEAAPQSPQEKNGENNRGDADGRAAPAPGGRHVHTLLCWPVIWASHSNQTPAGTAGHTL